MKRRNDATQRKNPELTRKSDSKGHYAIVKRCLLFLSLTCYTTVTFWLFYPYTPIEIEGPIVICNEGKKVKPGSLLIYQMTINKKRDIGATIYKQLINDFIITYSPTHNNFPLGKRSIKVKIKVPLSAELGDYYFKWEAIYQVNLLRKVTVTAFSEPFKVTGK